MSPDDQEWLRQSQAAGDEFLRVLCDRPFVPDWLATGARYLVEGVLSKTAAWVVARDAETCND